MLESKDLNPAYPLLFAYNNLREKNSNPIILKEAKYPYLPDTRPQGERGWYSEV